MSAGALFATKRAITRFTLQLSRRSAFLFGLLVGGLPALQGPAYAATYPDAAERAQFVHTLAANPALGMLYGNAADALRTEGYIVYRCLAVLLCAAAVWGLLSATKLFRGQEEDGRWELVLTGQTTPAQAMIRTTLGWLAAGALGTFVGGAIIAALGLMPSLAITLSSGFFFAVVVMTMAVCGFAVGMLTSQLGATRRRATIYGLMPLLALYVLRSVENISNGLGWIRWFNPFCWLENAQPIVASQPLWLFPVLGLATICAAVALLLVRHRDLGDSLISGPDIVRPRYGLLQGIVSSSLRLGWPLLVSWATVCMAVMAIIATVAKTAVEAVGSSQSLSNAVSSLAGGSGNLALSFLGMTTFFGGGILVAMAAGAVGAMRKDEARSYVDNLLARPVSRARWLGVRVGLIIAGLTVTLAGATVAVWAIAAAQGITLDGPRYVFETGNILGPVLLVAGLGVCLYGWRPRLAAASMYGVLLWSFVIDLIGSTVQLNAVLAHTSIFRHMALTPAAHPQWRTAVITLVCGLVFMGIGCYLFTRRDLEVE